MEDSNEKSGLELYDLSDEDVLEFERLNNDYDSKQYGSVQSTKKPPLYKKKQEASPEKETEIMSKVEHTFYWYAKRDVKVEIAGDFTNWNNVLMKPITSGDAPVGATHSIKKFLDPKIHHFRFKVDDAPKLSSKYEKEGEDNLINLENAPTKIYIKKGIEKSQYDNISRFLENEQNNLEQENKSESQNSSKLYEEIRNQQESSPELSFDALIQQAELKQRSETVKPKGLDRKLMLDMKFLDDLDDTVQKNSPLKLTGKNKSKTQEDFAFEINNVDSVGSDKPQDIVYQKPMSRRGRNFSLSYRENFALKQQEVHQIQDDFESENIDIPEASESLFNNLFLEAFEKYQSTQILQDTGNIFITFQQFKETIDALEFENEDKEHLMSLYSMTKLEDKGLITKDELMQAIIKDLKIQYGNNSSSNDEIERVEASPEPQPSPLVYQHSEEQAFKRRHNKLEASMAEPQQYQSPNINIDVQNRFSNILGAKEGNNLRDNSPSSGIITAIKCFDEGNAPFVPEEKITWQPPLSNRGQKINNFFHDEPAQEPDNLDDPILRQIYNLNISESVGDQRCENIRQSLEYIISSKVDFYSQNPDRLRSLFTLLTQNNQIMKEQFETLQDQVQKLEAVGTDEVMKYQEHNEELEAQLDQMEAELGKMRVYEQSYHTQEKRLTAALDRCDQLFSEKSNIETAHFDIVKEFNILKKNNEKLQMNNRVLKLEAEEQQNQVNNLKNNIMNMYSQQANQKEEKEEKIHKLEDLSDECSVKSYRSAIESEQEEPDQLIRIDEKSEESEKIVDQQDIPSDIDPMQPLEVHQQLSPAQGMNKILEEEEENILQALETTEIFKLKNRIKSYIENNVRLNRSGLKNIIKGITEKSKEVEQGLKQQNQMLRFQNEQLFTDLKTTRFEKTQWQNQCDTSQREIELLQEQLQQIIQQNQDLKDEKVRIMGVNSMLEQKIQVEKSELMSVRNEFDNVLRYGNDDVMSSKMSRKLGQMSSYISRQQNAIRSMKGSSYSGAQSIRSRKIRPKLGSAISGFDMQSQRQRVTYMDDCSSFRGSDGNVQRIDGNSEDSCSDFDINRKDVKIIDDNQSMSSNGSVVVRRKGDSQSSFGGSIRSKRSGDSSSFYRHVPGTPSNKSGFAKRLNQSLKGSVKSKSSRRKKSSQGRVQVISDFDSEDESIENLSQNQMLEINEEIEEQEKNELKIKRESNNYDQCGLQAMRNLLYVRINQMVEKHYLDRKVKYTPLLNAEKQSIYSEKIKLYINKVLKPMLMIMYNGFVYIATDDENPILTIQPFSFLDDICKVKFSEIHEAFLAMQLRDMRKTQGTRDHIIIEVKDRELFADFIMEYAEREEDEIVFEQNEEFSMIVNSTPVWFSFDDVDRSKKLEKQLIFKSQDVTGFVEIKQNQTINLLRVLFQKNANWVQRYLSLKGVKLSIFQGQKYDKPISVLTLTHNMVIDEIHKADINGKQYVLTISPGKEQPAEWICAATESQYNKWLNAFRTLKQQFITHRQLEVERLKEAFKPIVIKKDKSNTIFSKSKTDIDAAPVVEEVDDDDLFDNAPNISKISNSKILVLKHSVILEDDEGQEDNDNSSSNKNGSSLMGTSGKGTKASETLPQVVVVEESDSESFQSCRSGKPDSEYSVV